jgi:hypothetical protein
MKPANANALGPLPVTFAVAAIRAEAQKLAHHPFCEWEIADLDGFATDGDCDCGLRMSVRRINQLLTEIERTCGTTEGTK